MRSGLSRQAFRAAWRFDLTHAECLRFHVEVGFSVDVGGVDGDVTEPGADGIDIDASPEQVGCGRMPDHMRVRRVFCRISGT